MRVAYGVLQLLCLHPPTLSELRDKLAELNADLARARQAVADATARRDALARAVEEHATSTRAAVAESAVNTLTRGVSVRCKGSSYGRHIPIHGTPALRIARGFGAWEGAMRVNGDGGGGPMLSHGQQQWMLERALDLGTCFCRPEERASACPAPSSVLMVRVRCLLFHFAGHFPPLVPSWSFRPPSLPVCALCCTAALASQDERARENGRRTRPPA